MMKIRRQKRNLAALALLLVCLMLMGLAGCSGNPSATAGPNPTPTAPAENTPKPVEPTLTPEPTPEATSGATPDPTDAPSIPGLDTSIDTNSPAFLHETEDAGQEYIDKIIFLGDSTTYGLRHYGMLSGGEDTLQVWTPASGTLTLSYQSVATIVYPDDGSEITIKEAVERKKPEIMVITLGVNGVSFMDEASFKREYTDLVETIKSVSPGTKIILQSIFPVAASYEYLSSINNEKILEANRWVLDVAQATGVKYLNTISVLLGEDGWLPEDYHNGDGIHLNPDSFTLVLNYIRTHAYK